MLYRKFGSTPVCSVIFRVQIVIKMLLVKLDTNRIIKIEVLLSWPDEVLSERKLENFSARPSMKLSPGGPDVQRAAYSHTACSYPAVSRYDAEFETDLPLGKGRETMLHCWSVRVLQLKLLQDINRLAWPACDGPLCAC